jgi:predicted nucleotidyltransferase
MLEQTMDEVIEADPILKRFRAALADIYGDRLERVVLFGSRARGEAGPDSDYDVAVFLKALPDRWAELDRLADLRVRFLDETGAFFDAKPYLTTAYRDATLLMREIRRDGLEL